MTISIAVIVVILTNTPTPMILNDNQVEKLALVFATQCG